MTNPPLEWLAPEHIRVFEPYYPSPPDSELKRLYGLDTLHRLHNNENPLGPPQAVRELLAKLQPEMLPLYPSGDSKELREALALKHGKVSEQFLVGNGSCELISSVVKAFCEKGDNIVTADKTFAVYEWVAEFSGLEARLTPLRDDAFDPQALLDARDARTKILFVCTPNNPTGGAWDLATLEWFLEQVGGERIVVLDEAYFEYVGRPERPDGLQLLKRYPNLVVFRTFSKMYGLAALRIGYLCASAEVVDIIRRTHVAYSVNRVGQLAARVALDDDQEFIKATRRMVARSREQLVRACAELGLETKAGDGNYMMVKTPLADTLLQRKLLFKGFMVRSMTGFRFPDWIRVSLVQEDVMEAFCEVFCEVLRQD